MVMMRVQLAKPANNRDCCHWTAGTQIDAVFLGRDPQPVVHPPGVNAQKHQAGQSQVHRQGAGGRLMDIVPEQLVGYFGPIGEEKEEQEKDQHGHRTGEDPEDPQEPQPAQMGQRIAPLFHRSLLFHECELIRSLR